MSKTFSKIRLTADNGSVDEYLWTNSVGTKDEPEYTDGYQDFIEDDIKEFEKLGDEFLRACLVSLCVQIHEQNFFDYKENGCRNTDVLQARLTQLSEKSAEKMCVERYRTGS